MSDHFGNISIQKSKSRLKRSARKIVSPGPLKPTGKQSQPESKMWLWIFILAGLLGLYAIAGFVGVPYYITKILPKDIYEKTGFIFHPGNVSFNPLTFSFNTENIRILSKQDDRPDLLNIKNVKMKLAPFSLLRNDLVSNSLIIEELEAHVNREIDGSYNFSSLVESSNLDNAAGMMAFSALPFHFSLNNIDISGSKITFSDLPLRKTHIIEDIQLALPTLSNFPFQAGNYIRPHFSAVINGSPLELTGEAAVGEAGDENRTTDLSCDIQTLDLPFYFSYLPFDLPFNFTQGKADGKIGLKFSPEEKKGRKLAINFDLKIAGTEMSTHDSTIKITAPTVHLIGVLHPVSRYIQLETLSLRDPVFSSYGQNFSDNLRQIFSEEKKPEPLRVQSEPHVTTDIDLMIVDGGMLRVFQMSASGKPDITWDALQFHLKHYSSSEDRGKGEEPGSFRLTGEQRGASSFFSWQGKLTTPNLLDGALTINNMRINNLLRSFDIKPFVTSEGVADLRGRFLLSLSGDTSHVPFFNLTDTTISVQNFLLKEEKSTVLSAPLVTVSGFSTSDKKTVFGSVAIENGTLNLTRGQLPDSFSLFSENSERGYRLDSLSFDGKATILTGEGNDSKLHFPGFSLKAKDFYLTKGADNNISIVAGTQNGGSISTEGHILLSPFKVSLETEFKGLQSGAVFSLFADSSALTRINGLLDGKGTFTLPQAEFTGNLSLNRVSIVEKKKTIIKWKNSVFHDVNFSAKPFHLAISLAEFESPVFSWKIDSGDNSPLENFTDLLQKYLPLSTKPTSSSFNIKEVVVENGTIEVEDQRLSPPWQGSITDFNGAITGLQPGKNTENSQLKFQGKLDDSPFIIQGQSNFFSKQKNGSFTFTLTDFPLAAFYKQLGSQLEIDTSRGAFDLNLDSHWKAEQLNNSGSVIFSGVQAEYQSSESALTLSLLTDQDNSFNLDFSFIDKEPVSQLTLFDHLITRFQKLIIKASVSPFLLASGDFTDLTDSEFIEFRPGEFIMSEKGRITLARYGSFLTTNPNIGLTLSGSYNHTIDSAAMKMQLETTESERVTVDNQRRLKKWQGQKELYRKTLEQKQKKMVMEGKIVELDIPPKFLQEFNPTQPQQVEVTENMLQELADKRVQSVNQYFISQLSLEPQRIAVADTNQTEPTAGNSPNGVSINIRGLEQ